MAEPKRHDPYKDGYIAGQAAERSMVVRYLKGVLLTERAQAISRGEHLE